MWYHKFCIRNILFLLSILLIPFRGNAQFFNTNAEKTPETTAIELPKDPYGRRTPQGTVQGFISSVANQNYSTAAEYFKLKKRQNGEQIARQLQILLDKGGSLQPYARLSDKITGTTTDDLPQELEKVGRVNIGEIEFEIILQLVEGIDGPIWLFSTETVARIAAAENIEGPLINLALPDVLRNRLWFGAPVGHWIGLIILLLISYLLAWGLTHLIRVVVRYLWPKAGVDPVAGIMKALALPIGLAMAVWFFVYLSEEVGISIILRQKFSSLYLIIGVIAILLLLWRVTHFIGNFSQNQMVLRGNASGMSIVQFLQRAAKISIVIVGFIVILGVIGVDVTAGLAALGIGGIALALGAQKSVENFVGSVTLITDQPIRVGDFCKVGDTMGTVERIGMRSTRIRTLARTVVTIPNGEFSSARIENYALRDRFWLHNVYNLRYETSPDQIRYLLVEMRTVLYSHPKVLNDPARVRFIRLGSSSIDLEIFAYIEALDYNEYLEVQEDVMLRMMDVVEKSGTGFAFPSQTIYMAKDGGLSEEKSHAARGKVEEWKEKGEMQIPHFDPDRIEEIKDSLSYPPEGSASAGAKKD